MRSKDRPRYVLTVDHLRGLFDELSDQGYEQVGPIFRDGAIMLEKINSFDELTLGYLEQQDKGSYNLDQHPDAGYFQYSVGPQSFKKFLNPPRRKLWEANGSSSNFEITVPERPAKMVFWGVRNCDIEAIRILDKVFLEGAYVNDWYQAAKEDLLIIAVGCTHPSKNCFCTSFDSGPMPYEGYDLSLVEVKDGAGHHFIADGKSDLIKHWLNDTEAQLASKDDLEIASRTIEEAIDNMPIRLNPKEASELLKTNLEHSHWEQVASRCLSCANCTLVCPTCFCSTTEDITDISGDHTERWLTWDSCFVGDFSYIHGGQIRPSTRSRYRQWMTHKLSNWYDQFGSSGCVGCGRCITWCPVGIDITEELAAINDNPVGPAKDKKSRGNEKHKGST